jgi:hypothetical protein
MMRRLPLIMALTAVADVGGPCAPQVHSPYAPSERWRPRKYRPRQQKAYDAAAAKRKRKAVKAARRRNRK